MLAAGRRDPHLGDGAPLQHRALAAALRGDAARSCASRRSTTAASSILDEFERLLTPRTKIVAVAHVSNALGTINPVARDHRDWRTRAGVAGADRRRAGGVRTCAVDVQALDCDFYVAPATSCTARPASACSTAREALLEAMPPYQGGGDMIASVTFEKTHLERRCRTSSRPARRTSPARSACGAAHRLPRRRSASTRSRAHEHDAARVRHRARSQAIRRRAPDRHGARTRPSVLSFVIDGVHPHDIGTILDREGIAVRTGHHCAQPVMDRFGIPATARASLAIYNTRDEIDALGRALRQGARGVRLMSDLTDLYQEVILDHNRRPRNFRAIDERQPHGRGLQPALRRPADALSQGRRTTSITRRRRSRAPAAPSRRRRRR